jgi:hypothetical protein
MRLRGVERFARLLLLLLLTLPLPGSVRLGGTTHSSRTVLVLAIAGLCFAFNLALPCPSSLYSCSASTISASSCFLSNRETAALVSFSSSASASCARGQFILEYGARVQCARDAAGRRSGDWLRPGEIYPASVKLDRAKRLPTPWLGLPRRPAAHVRSPAQ